MCEKYILFWLTKQWRKIEVKKILCPLICFVTHYCILEQNQILILKKLKFENPTDSGKNCTKLQ